MKVTANNTFFGSDPVPYDKDASHPSMGGLRLGGYRLKEL